MASKDFYPTTTLRQYKYAVVYMSMSDKIEYSNVTAVSKNAVLSRLKRRSDVKRIISIRAAEKK